MNDSQFQLPDGIAWLANYVLQCSVCRTKKDFTGKLDEVHDFVIDHADCQATKPRGDQLASSMTIREAIAMHLLVREKNGVAAAISDADLLLECLADSSFGLKRPKPA